MSGLKAGTATVEITPSDLTGLNAMGPDFIGVHDRLFVRALVLATDAATIALVSLDQLEVGVTVDLRSRIEAETGIPSSHILIAPTHSHNAPRAGLTPEGGLSRAPSARSLQQTSATFDAIAEAVAMANARRVSAKMGTTTGYVDANTNRNVLRDGEWVLGAASDGPSDKRVVVLTVDEAGGGALATVFIYAVHPTVSLGTRLVSADIAGAAVRAVERGRGGTALWLPGAIGDQAPRDSAEARLGRGESVDVDGIFTLVDQIGAEIGDEVVRLTDGLSTHDAPVTLTGAERTVAVRSHRGTGLPPDMPQTLSDSADVRLTMLRIGDLALIGVGGEVTVPAAARLVAAETAPVTAVVSIANERMGYLADPEAFELGQFAARGCPVQPEWVEECASVVAAHAGGVAE